MKVCKSCLIIALCVISVRAMGFDGHKVAEGPLNLTIGELKTVTEYDAPQTVAVSVANTGGSPLKVKLRVGDLVDQWHVVGPDTKTVELSAGQQQNVSFQIAAGKGACSALYPVHVYAAFEYDGRQMTTHAVQIFESNFKKPVVASAKPPPLKPNIVPVNGVLQISRLRTGRVAWQYFDKPLQYMPVGWQGSEEQSSASLSFGPVARGITKDSITMHPPWKGGPGTVFIEYVLKLPDVTPIMLTFANAIRDHSATEPPSDGVTFRVWAGDEKLFERHTDSKTWLDGEVDLGKFAGKEILLRLESHPGPKRDTTCDSSFWGQPTVIAGNMSKGLTESERQRLRSRAGQIVLSRTEGRKDEFTFDLDDGYKAAVISGAYGLIDGVLAFGGGQRCVLFDGFNVSILGHQLTTGPSEVVLRNVISEMKNGKLTVVHRLSFEDDVFDLTVRLWAQQGGLRVQLACPKRITALGVGSADQKAPRVYYGHGYCITEPKAFRAGFGGHNLSTSHVGFDFEKGMSLLMACDNPPDYLQVDPDQRLYSLCTHLDATLTFVPSVKGAFDCAFKYRPLYDKKASPAVSRKAGRFVFDIWGGRYAEIADTMKRMIAYGLTDSLLTLHVWQRWGYDYRLPDIYPPLPSLGSVEDMLKIAQVCAEHDIPWGLHDNYIDFYPDACDYSYEHICFTEAGEPVKAWLNEGRRAQSYRWRPDHIMPFVQRNLKLIKPNLKPTHYFIDVFTSIECFDYYDRAGSFHSMLETRRCWGESFAWIRDYLGGDAPMTSEAGHDQLVGYLEGADCQHLTISQDQGWTYIRLPCRDWERVPWFDAVLHDKFSLHGVGYPSRYKVAPGQTNSPVLETDDYISAELLDGHALMIDHRGFGRGAIRKYWLAQDFIRSIAMDQIADVEFAEGNIHRQIIRWKSGAVVHVNRGADDWQVAGKCLPQFGYYAKSGSIESSIEKISGCVVEQSRAPGRFYVNGRGSKTGVTDFGPVITTGALRCEMRENMLVVTPLPDTGPFDVVLRLDRITGTKDAAAKTVIAVDAGGQRLRQVDFSVDAKTVKFAVRPGEFAYQIRSAE
jgi:hypothetical protein